MTVRDVPHGHSEPEAGDTHQAVRGRRWDEDLVPDAAGRTSRPEASCPVEVALEAISGRWTTLLLRDLMSGPRSYGQIRAALPTLSDKVLADRLRELQDRGLVHRRLHCGFPARTSYELSTAGRHVRPLLMQLYETGLALQPERRP